MLATLLAVTLLAAGDIPPANAPVVVDDRTLFDPLARRFLHRPAGQEKRAPAAPVVRGQAATAQAVVACSGPNEAYPFDSGNYGVGNAIALLPDADYPYDATMNAAEEVWIPGAVGDGVVVLDRTGGVAARIPVGRYAIGVAFTTDGVQALVTSRDDDNISVIDATGYAVRFALPMPASPGNIALDPVSGNFYAVEWYGTDLFEIAPDGSAVLRTATLGSNLWQLVVSPDGSRIYVTERDSSLHLVRVIDRASLTEIRTVAVGLDPWGIDVTADGTKVVVACEDSHSAHVIDTATFAVTDVPLDADADPRDVDILDPSGLAFVAGGVAGTRSPVYVIDIAAGALRSSFDVPGSNTNVVAVQAQGDGGGGGCTGPPPEVPGLIATKASNDVRLRWGAVAEAQNGYNVWRVADKTLIPSARTPPGPTVVGVCPGTALVTCDDLAAATGPADTRYYYQVRGLCGASEGL